MTEFTKEEISLCKQIVEKHRKEIVFGDWYLDYRDDSIGLYQQEKPFKTTVNVFPLWNISDSLSWLEERGFNHEFHFKRFKLGGWSFTAEDNKYKKVRGEGETKRAACLKAVLAVLEEGK